MTTTTTALIYCFFVVIESAVMVTADSITTTITSATTVGEAATLFSYSNTTSTKILKYHGLIVSYTNIHVEEVKYSQ